MILGRVPRGHGIFHPASYDEEQFYFSPPNRFLGEVLSSEREEPPKKKKWCSSIEARVIFFFKNYFFLGGVTWGGPLDPTSSENSSSFPLFFFFNLKVFCMPTYAYAYAMGCTFGLLRRSTVAPPPIFIL